MQLRPSRPGLATADTFLTADGTITAADGYVEARAVGSHTPDTYLVAADSSFVTPDDRLSGTPVDSFVAGSSEATASTADSFVASVASSFSHGSPYSSLASPCSSQQGFFDSR